MTPDIFLGAEGRVKAQGHARALATGQLTSPLRRAIPWYSVLSRVRICLVSVGADASMDSSALACPGGKHLRMQAVFECPIGNHSSGWSDGLSRTATQPARPGECGNCDSEKPRHWIVTVVLWRIDWYCVQGGSSPRAHRIVQKHVYHIRDLSQPPEIEGYLPTSTCFAAIPNGVASVGFTPKAVFGACVNVGLRSSTARWRILMPSVGYWAHGFFQATLWTHHSPYVNRIAPVVSIDRGKCAAVPVMDSDVRARFSGASSTGGGRHSGAREVV
ncbi:hypothetical protein BV22DRAFT_1045597 [Leucogyrophana mollusca]|uniref:Uncharacterized protein n=1 Tax=Leucogyrophana mollusca TaxID=85980 RepID=A0ACB8BML7_9AGAM|nr:hypothetical protein BV22DRAFT_1045597 [Leucogyrophana mollusca]